MDNQSKEILSSGPFGLEIQTEWVVRFLLSLLYVLPLCLPGGWLWPGDGSMVGYSSQSSKLEVQPLTLLKELNWPLKNTWIPVEQWQCVLSLWKWNSDNTHTKVIADIDKDGVHEMVIEKRRQAFSTWSPGSSFYGFHLSIWRALYLLPGWFRIEITFPFFFYPPKE